MKYLSCSYSAVFFVIYQVFNLRRDKFAQTHSMLNYLHQYVLGCIGILNTFLPYHVMGIDAYFFALHSQKSLPCTGKLGHQISNDLYEGQVEIQSYSSLGAIVNRI